MSHKLTPDIRKRLAEFAAKITDANAPAPIEPGRGLTGAELAARGLTTDRHGKPLAPMQVYLAKDAPRVNHARRLNYTFQRGGWPAVQLYLQPYLTPEGYARQQAAASAPAEQPAEVATDGLLPAVVFKAEQPTGAPAVGAWLDEAGEVPEVFGALPPIDEPLAESVLSCEPLAEYPLQLVQHLYEAGHPGPMPATECAPCSGQCGICERAA